MNIEQGMLNIEIKKQLLKTWTFEIRCSLFDIL